MYAEDELGRMIVDAGHDWLRELKPEECFSVPCLILTHPENIKDQQACLRFYSKLEPLLPTELHVFRAIFEEHLRITDRCSCFPHHDHYYGRQTLEVGRKLMESPGLRFDFPLIAEGGNVRFGHEPQKLWDATQMTFNVVERLDSFVKNKLKRKNTVVTDWLIPKKAAECREAFRKFDKNGSGFLDTEELAAVLQATGWSYTQTELQSTIDTISGSSGSKGTTFDQFAAILQACLQGLDSLLTRSEITEMMKKCDANNDGMISYEEFVSLVPVMIMPVSAQADRSLWDIMSPVELSSAVMGGFGWAEIKTTT
ncbi:EF-hand [Zopfia rhizophila CBS 207.26]|uniref:Calmodulin n=1 Tax=Zopfia rhizophila CBS 207.26 TaxID=1314779 RepID=A0A6A6DJD0_9PEZI|nr:EF-hand [Zopfia rhizophila CBS 207.26]